MTFVRTNNDGSHVMRANHAMTRAEAWALAQKLATQTGVKLAAPIDPDAGLNPPAKPPARGK